MHVPTAAKISANSYGDSSVLRSRALCDGRGDASLPFCAALLLGLDDRRSSAARAEPGRASRRAAPPRQRSAAALELYAAESRARARPSRVPRRGSSDARPALERAVALAGRIVRSRARSRRRSARSRRFSGGSTSTASPTRSRSLFGAASLDRRCSGIDGLERATHAESRASRGRARRRAAQTLADELRGACARLDARARGADERRARSGRRRRRDVLADRRGRATRRAIGAPRTRRSRRAAPARR